MGDRTGSPVGDCVFFIGPVVDRGLWLVVGVGGWGNCLGDDSCGGAGGWHERCLVRSGATVAKVGAVGSAPGLL